MMTSVFGIAAAALAVLVAAETFFIAFLVSLAKKRNQQIRRLDAWLNYCLDLEGCVVNWLALNTVDPASAEIHRDNVMRVITEGRRPHPLMNWSFKPKRVRAALFNKGHLTPAEHVARLEAAVITYEAYATTLQGELVAAHQKLLELEFGATKEGNTET